MNSLKRRLQITLSSETINLLNRYSVKYGMTKSNLIEVLVKKYIRREFGEAE